MPDTTLFKAILLVEDNPDDAELTKRALTKAGITNPIVVAKDGQEAIQMLSAGKVLPVVVLLDLHLPKIDGHEVLCRIRKNERTALLPVVVLTSSIHDEDLIKSYKCGANSYIQKPVESDRFNEAVRQLGLYWTLLNKAPIFQTA